MVHGDEIASSFRLAANRTWNWWKLIKYCHFASFLSFLTMPTHLTLTVYSWVCSFSSLKLPYLLLSYLCSQSNINGINNKTNKLTLENRLQFYTVFNLFFILLHIMYFTIKSMYRHLHPFSIYTCIETIYFMIHRFHLQSILYV